MKTLYRILPAALAGAVALAAGVWASGALLGPRSLDQAGLEATYMADSRAVTGFQLVDHRGRPFTDDDLEGRWTLLFFGFTYCPDICPTTLASLDRVHAQLADAGLASQLQTVFVTVDPARDTPERLEAYVTNFRDDFLGVTGPLEEIDVLARDLGIAHIRHDDAGDANYAVDHGASILLVNPRGRLQALFSAPHRARSMSADLERILTFHGSS